MTDPRRVLRSFLFPLVLAAAGCHSNQAPLENPQSVAGKSATGEAYTVNQIAAAIRSGAQAKRWNILSDEPGTMQARQDAGGHYAVVDISYNEAGWTISYLESSPGLIYEETEKHGPIIHHRYNLWVRHLDAAIRKFLGAPASAAVPAGDEAITPTGEEAPAAEPQDGWDAVEQEAEVEAAPEG